MSIHICKSALMSGASTIGNCSLSWALGGIGSFSSVVRQIWLINCVEVLRALRWGTRLSGSQLLGPPGKSSGCTSCPKATLSFCCWSSSILASRGLSLLSEGRSGVCQGSCSLRRLGNAGGGKSSCWGEGALQSKSSMSAGGGPRSSCSNNKLLVCESPAESSSGMGDLAVPSAGWLQAWSIRSVNMLQMPQIQCAWVSLGFPASLSVIRLLH